MGDIFNPTDEHRALREMVRAFTESQIDPRAEENDRDERFDQELFGRLGELGLLGITVDERFGGAGMDPTAAVIAHEEISAADPGFALAFLAHSMLFANNLNVNGDDEQRARYLPDACSGKTVCGMCMTEPDAGTDVLGLRTTATRNGDRYILNGAKMWITNGAVTDSELGDVFLVYARLKEHNRNQLSMFIVEKGFPGFKLGQKITGKLGCRASTTAELVFEDCEVPAQNLVGTEGSATIHMMRNLEIERLTLAGMSLGIARRSLEIMNNYASERLSFGKKLREFGQVQRHLAESYAEYMAARTYTYWAAQQMDLNAPGHRLDSDGVKLFSAAIGKTIADRAIQVLGGYGYVAEYQVERLWRDSKLLEIGGGTLEAHHKNMTRELSRLDRIL